METRLYECEYCKIEFLPARRKIQKFCSNSCRSKSHHQKTKKDNKLSTLNLGTKPTQTSIDKMSFAGVGNAAVGTLAVEAIKSIFISEENKPATKKDIQNLVNKFQRYRKVHNMNPNMNGQLPYFDVDLSVVIYK